MSGAIEELIELAEHEHLRPMADAARAELAALRAENDELRRSREGWQADALNYAKSRGYQEQMADELRATVEAQAKQIEQANVMVWALVAAVGGKIVVPSILLVSVEKTDRVVRTELVDGGTAFTTPGTPSTVAVVPLERLREIEWAGWDDTLGVACCPVCLTTAGLGDGHAPDCWLAAAIKGDA